MNYILHYRQPVFAEQFNPLGLCFLECLRPAKLERHTTDVGRIILQFAVLYIAAVFKLRNTVRLLCVVVVSVVNTTQQISQSTHTLEDNNRITVQFSGSPLTYQTGYYL